MTDRHTGPGAGDSGDHLTEEALILLHYGESEESEAAGRHLSRCAPCAAARDEIRAALEIVTAADAVVPDPPDDYAERVWDRIRPRLEAHGADEINRRRRSPRPFPYRGWAIAASLMVMLLAGFLAGRFSIPVSDPPPRPIDSAGIDRVLMVAAEDHLERTRRMIAEVANLNGTTAADGPATVDFGTGRQRALDLAAATRILRRSARARGEVALEYVLEEVERLLVSMAHAPADLPREDLHDLQRRIEDQGILLKLHAVSESLRQRGLRPRPAAGATTT